MTYKAKIPPRRALVVKPSSLGDILHLFPALSLLHRAWPETVFDFLVCPAFAPILDYAPCPIRRRILFRRKELGRPGTFFREFPELCRELRKEPYDLVIDFQGLFRSALFSRIAGRTAGFAAPRERTARFLYSDRIAVRPEHVHAVERYVDLADGLTGRNDPVPRCELPVNPGEAEALRRVAGTLPPSLIAMIPGARWESKKFPPELFAETALALYRRMPELTFALLGAGDDREAGDRIRALLNGRVPLLNLTGKTSLGGMMELLRASRAVISNDSGPMHAAAALGRRVYAFFGPTDPEKTGPYGPEHRICRLSLDCAGCLRRKCPRGNPPPCHRLDAERIAAEIWSDISQ